MKNLKATFLGILFLCLFSTTLIAQYNYGLEVCDYDIRFEGKLNLDSDNLNVFIGVNSGINNTISATNSNHGVRNTYLGWSTGTSNTTGYRNTFIGNLAGYNNLAGFENTFLGAFSGNDNLNGFNNLFVGSNSGRKNTSGFQNTFIGKASGFENVTGSDNTFVGTSAGQDNNTGSENVYIGQWSGRFNQSGDSNVFLGYRSGYSELGSNKLYIENSDSATPLIYGEFDNNSVVINGDLCYTGTLNSCSDIRFKKNIKPITDVLENINQLNGISHEWRHNEFSSKVWKKGSEYGLIAQEVQKVYPDLVNIDDDGYMYVDYVKMTPILLEAIKEQSKQIKELEKNLSQNTLTMDTLLDRVKSLESKLNESDTSVAQQKK